MERPIYIASMHRQLNALTFELFCTTMSHIRDFGPNYRGRLRCTYETSAESVKFYLKSDKRRGAKQVAIIDRAVIDSYNVQRQLSCRTGSACA